MCVCKRKDNIVPVSHIYTTSRIMHKRIKQISSQKRPFLKRDSRDITGFGMLRWRRHYGSFGRGARADGAATPGGRDSQRNIAAWRGPSRQGILELIEEIAKGRGLGGKKNDNKSVPLGKGKSGSR